MPGITAATYKAFGRNEYLKSTRATVFESWTVALTSVPVDADGNRVLQSGTVLSKITSAAGTSTAADVGLLGPTSGTATDGRQTAANIIGVCDSFFPYQLTDFNREVSVLIVGFVDGTRCYEYVGAEVSPGTLGLAAGTKTNLSTRTAVRDIKVA